MRAKELVQSITGSKGFVLEDITGSTSRPALSVSVLLMRSPVFVVIPHTALLFTALCGTSFPVPHNAVLSACRFGYPSILLLSFPDSLSRVFFHPIGSLSFSLLSATKLHFFLGVFLHFIIGADSLYRRFVKALKLQTV